MARAQRLEEALEIDERRLAEQVAGLPEDKVMCFELATAALHRAIRDCLPRPDPQSGSGSSGVI